MKREWMGAARLGVVLFLLYLAIHYWGALSSLLLLGLGPPSPWFWAPLSLMRSISS